MYVVLVYDICTEDGGQKILSRVFKICKKYLCHVQNSVFEGELSETQLTKLKYELKQHLRDQSDSIIVFKSRQEKWLEKEFLGIQEDRTSNFI